MLKKTLVIATLAASTAMLCTVGTAEAGKRGLRLHFGHHHHFKHRHHRPYFYVYSGSSCRYYYKKWKWTGSSYWKHKYYDCIS